MNTRVQAEKAEQFRKLHHGPRMLVLANAWDVVSARILEECGHPAIATSSAAVAFSRGYPDGQRISRDEMLDVVARIARAVRAPVTADLEAGYGTTVKDMAETVKATIGAGAIGMNLEDVTGDDESSHVALPLQVEKIRAIRETAKSLGVPFVLNARTDIYLMPIGPEATRFERTVERLRAYRDAGADCLFAPGLYDREMIAKLVKAVEAPINILANPACPPRTGKNRGSSVKRGFGDHARRNGGRAASWKGNVANALLRDDVRWSNSLRRLESHDESSRK